jgi:hypothetical protein
MSQLLGTFVGQGMSGLPEDQVVNTFWFSNATAAATHITVVMDALERFYTNAAAAGGIAAQTNAIGAYLSSWVNPTATLKVYDQAQAEPRVPSTRSITLPSRLAGTGLPEEVSVCLSFRGALPSTARRRGRIFLGPLNNATGTFIAGGSGGPSRPGATLTADLALAAQKLASALANPGADWCVHSRTANNYVPVAAGFIDNRFDTQRRRGPDSDGRTLWSA